MGWLDGTTAGDGTDGLNLGVSTDFSSSTPAASTQPLALADTTSFPSLDSALSAYLSVSGSPTDTTSVTTTAPGNGVVDVLHTVLQTAQKYAPQAQAAAQIVQRNGSGQVATTAGQVNTWLTGLFGGPSQPSDPSKAPTLLQRINGTLNSVPTIEWALIVAVVLLAAFLIFGR